MPLKLEEAPADWQGRIQKEAQRLLASATSGAVQKLQAGERLEASHPIPVYRVSSRAVEQRGVSGNRELTGWCSLLFSRDRPEEKPVAALSFEPREDQLKVTRAQVGASLRQLVEALDKATSFADASQADYAPHLVEVPGLLFGAVLLESRTSGSEDVVFPLVAEASVAVSLAEIDAALRPEATRHLAMRRA